MNSRISAKLMFIAVVLLAAVPGAAAEDGHHQHHIAVSGGIALHNSKNSGFVGIDNIYRFESNFALGVFTEQVRGDYDVNAFGEMFGKYFDNGWKVATDPGVETKIKENKNLLL